jgi:ketosteroid isomerase-like protein
MKTLIMASVLVIAASSLSFAQEEQEIMKLSQEYYQVKVRNDVAGLNQLRSEDFFATTARGYAREWGNKRTRDINRNPRGDRYEAVKLEDLRVRIYGDAAVSTGLRAATFRTKEGKSRVSKLRFTQVWVKQQGQWKMVAAQVSFFRPRK